MAYSKEERQEIYDRICVGIAEGSSLRELCADGKPSIETIRVWLIEDADFSAQYTRAREAQAEFYADEIIHISDTEPDPAKARNRIDARKWKASKLAPKVYGDKLTLDGELNVTIPDDQLDARVAFLIGKAGTLIFAGGTGETEGPA
jgi:hypothetical protein